MTTGVIVYVDPSPNAPALTAALAATDDVALVEDAEPFDEEFAEARFLAIGDDLVPHEYVAVANDDDAQQSVTLAADAGVDYEAGLLVYPWDPDAEGADKRAVEYEAQVRLDGQDRTIPVIVRHTLIPLAGVDTLDGATVTIAEGADGEWEVAQVVGREPAIAASTVNTPYVRAHLTADVATFSGSRATLFPWTVMESNGIEVVDVLASTDVAFEVSEPGAYLVIGTVGWQDAGDGTNARNAYIITRDSAGGAITTIGQVTYAPTSGGVSQIQVVGMVYIAEPRATLIALEGRQTTGGLLNARGGAATDTRIEIVRVA